MTRHCKRPVAMLLFLASLGLLADLLAAADWPQWRGSNRNGSAVSSVPLANQWPREGPAMIWESEELPGHREGGLGSVVVAGGRVYLYVLWHRNDDIPHRVVSDSVLRGVGWDRNMPTGDLLAMVEKTRTSAAFNALSRNEQRDFARDFAEKHANTDEAKRWRGWIERRIREGDEAIALATFDKLVTIKDRKFESETALVKWFDEHKIDDATRKRVLDRIQKTTRLADDVVVCLDAATGKTVWKKSFPGQPNDARGSSTPAIVGDRLFVVGSGKAYCLDTKSGEPVWQTEVESKGVPSSFLVADGVAVVLARQLTAFDAKTGKILWQQKEVSGDQSSPVVWRHGGRSYVLCNTNKSLACVDLKSGEVAWTAPGGGISTPVVFGDTVVVASKDEKVGLAAHRMSAGGAKQLWTVPLKGRGAASPAIYNGHVYHVGSNVAMCVELESGKVMWQDKIKGEINSPIVADGKVFALTNNGGMLVMLDTSPEKHDELAKARIKALWCPSPAIVEGRLYLRMPKGVACFDLTGKVKRDD